MAQGDTESTLTNITELRAKPDPTTAGRQRRHRAKKRKRRATVTPRPATNVTPERQSSVTVRLATLIAALALATCSAAFSISGLTSIFAGAFWPVIGLGVAFELGKLSAVTWLGQRNGGRTLGLACIALVAVLMVVNSIGVYGFLSRAHIEHALAGDLTVASKGADIDARLSVQAGVVTDIDRRISQIDTAIEQTTAHGRGKAAMVLADAQRKNRAELITARTTEAVAEITYAYTPKKKMQGKDPDVWTKSNDDMKQAARDLAEAARAGDAAAIKAAAVRLNASCIDCHDVWRD